jgi:Zn-dependent peptidase ImmA (M78 family)/DNA-binding XRE family transcriptional regulator
MFNPKRLTLARTRRGVTKRKLADEIGIDERSILRFEKGEISPSDENVVALAKALSFPADFFELDAPPQVRARHASFRALSTKTKRQQESVLAAGAVAVEFSLFLDGMLRLPAPNVPSLRDYEGTPEEAAESLRAEWGLGNRPVANMIHLLEAHGVRVFSLVEDCAEVDAFTMRFNGVPFVFLNTQKSAERSRFDAAHELGHLVLHGHGRVTGREIEREADAFASAFLMPRSDVIARAPRLPSVADLIAHKKRWGVSVAALARRLHDTGLIREWHYKQLCVEISKRGYRTREPEEQPREVSQLLKKALELLRQKGISRRDIAAKLSVPPSEIDALVFGLTLTSVDGGQAGPTRRTRPAGTLRRVK